MIDHKGTVESNTAEDLFMAICSCGWTGPQRHNSDVAEADLDQHYKDSETVIWP